MVTQFSYWKGNQARNSYQICRGTLIALQLCFDICRLDIILAKQSLLLWACSAPVTKTSLLTTRASTQIQRGSSLSTFFVWSDPQRRGSSLLAHVLQIFKTLAIIHRDHVFPKGTSSIISYEWSFLRSLRFFKRDWIRDPHLFGVINHQHEFQ